jgi:hypothetical protein
MPLFAWLFTNAAQGIIIIKQKLIKITGGKRWPKKA